MNYRQGDVLLVGVKEVPADAVKDQPPTRVLATGSTSTHHHAVEGDCETFTRDGRRYLLLPKEAQLVVVGPGTPRHKPITLTPGAYEVRAQRSWTSESSRIVTD